MFKSLYLIKMVQLLGFKKRLVVTMAENTPKPHSNQNPAERDAKALKRHYPLSFLLQLLAFVLFLMLLMFVIFYFAIGTDRGTEFFLDKITQETGLEINYGKGNLRDGIWVTDLLIPNDDIVTEVDKAYVKIGWRALFVGELHLRDADINHIKIINSKLPDGKPYDYKTLQLPINMRLDKAKIGKISYIQPKTSEFVLADIDAKNLTWIGPKITVGSADVTYGNELNINQLKGEISLEGDYPLNVTAVASANFLKKAYIDDLTIDAHGSLKRTVGTIKSRYNEHKVDGDFQIQSLDSNAPFEAKLKWDKVKLPYFTSQEIGLDSGSATFSGIKSDIEMRVNTDVASNSSLIPNGHYQGRARIKPSSKLDIEYLVVDTQDGELNATGLLDWEGPFKSELVFLSQNYNLKKVIPKDYANYQGYLPDKLKGKLAFNFYSQNLQDQPQYNLLLTQDDGELIDVKVARGKPNRRQPTTPWYVKANWKNYHRKNASDGLGAIDSDFGVASAVVQGSRISIDTQANISKLSFAPVGNYDTKLIIKNNKIWVNDFNYNGQVGDLKGKGHILLATKKRPLSWQFDVKANEFLLKSYQSSMPIERISGHVLASGNMEDIQVDNDTKVKAGQKHTVAFKNADLTAWFDDSLDKRKVQSNGAQGTAVVWMVNGGLDKFDVQANSELEATGLPKGSWQVAVAGTPKLMKFDKLAYTGDAGKFTAAGRLDNDQKLAWDIKADLAKFSLGTLSADNPAVITGMLNTQGVWKPVKNKGGAGSLANLALKFDGNVEHPNLPTGRLQIDGVTKDNVLFINKLRHSGDAGILNAKGRVNLQNGYQWHIKGDMDKFNFGYFSKSYPAIVSGKIDTTGIWNTKNSQAKTQSSFSQLGDFKLDFAGNLLSQSSGNQLPSGQLVVNVSGNAQQLIIDKLFHQGEAGLINAEGQLSLTNGYQWQLKSNMQDFNLGYFIADMPSKLSGNIQTTGNWTDKLQILNVKNMDITGQLQNKPLVAQGSLEARLRLPKNIQSYMQSLRGNQLKNQYQKVQTLIEKLDAQKVTIRWGDNYIAANGNKNNLQTSVHIPNLVQISEKLNGEVVGRLTIVQKDDQALPTILIDMVASRLTLPNLLLAQGQVKGKVESFGNSNSQLVFTARDLEYGNKKFNHINAVYSGEMLNHTLNFAATNQKVTVSGVLKGGYNDKTMQWAGVLGNGKTVSKYTTLVQQQPTELKLDLHNPKIEVAAHCWQADKFDGKLCLREDMMVSSNQGKVNLAIQKIDTGILSVVLPKEMSWESTLSGNATVDWHKGDKPNVDAILYSDNGHIGLVQAEDNSTLTVPYERVSLIAKTQSDGLRIRTDIKSGGRATGYADVVIDPYKAVKSMSGKLVLNQLNLAIFKPFFPGIRTLKGNASLVGTLNGSLSKPLFNGDFQLANGQVSILGLPINLTKVNAKAKIDGDQANLIGRFSSGEGVGKLSGMIDWRSELQAKLNLSGENLYITQPPLLTAKINPDVEVIVKPLQKTLDIEGIVTVPTATIRPPEATNNIVTKTPDAVVLDRRIIGNLNEVLAASKPWLINANVGIDLGKDVNFKGFGAELPLTGALVVTQKGQQPMRAKGAVKVARRTKVDVFGQSLGLNFAQFKFNGYLQEPLVSIEAANDIEGRTVGLRAKGKLSNPDITVFNNAGLTEQQAMNALVTGRISNQTATQVNEEGFRSEITNNITAAGLSVGLRGTRNITNQIGRTVGLQNLTLSASGNGDDTNINVTGYITPDLYLRYGIGVFSAQNTLSARYQLTRRVYVEATSSVEKFVDVVYSWRF